jgi:hypothetical protein
MSVKERTVLAGGLRKMVALWTGDYLFEYIKPEKYRNKDHFSNKNIL